jgi:2-deoxy-D-gluconate 3-dehydrogenase
VELGIVEQGLVGKVALVTGSGRGLGEAMVDALVTVGVRVLATSRTPDGIEKLAARHGDRVYAVPFDLDDVARVDGLVQHAIRHFGRLDILVNDAALAPRGAFLHQDLATWESVVRVNVLAPFALSAAAGREFAKQGSGKIINIASTAGIRGKAGLVAYSASKAAVVQFTAGLAEELAPLGVQVNAIAPGAFATDMQAAVLQSDYLARRLKTIPAGRMAEPSEIGPLVCYLSSDVSNFVIGVTWPIDGGEVSHL